jgi:hypothetical protein
LKIRNSTKIAIGFVLLIAAVYFGYEMYSASVVDKLHFSEIKPGKVSLVGVNAGQGYKIIVAEQIAQLAEGDTGSFGPGEMNAQSASTETSSGKRRIPLQELLQTLQGDEKALTRLVTVMNDDLRKAEIPPNPVIWNSKDLEAALNGDAAKRTKLISDIGVGLDGKPTGSITVTALMQGIVIRTPLTINVSVAGQVRPMTAQIDLPYRSIFTRNVEKRLGEKSWDPAHQQEMIQGYYQEEATEEAAKNSYEDVATVLKARTNPQMYLRFADGPQRVLENAKVILNEDFILNAKWVENNSQNQNTKLYDIVVNLNDEGRKRLWQYTRHRVGSQLLLIVNGVAIAAPRVQHELAQSEITITQLPDLSLVQEAVDTINSGKKQVAQR